MREHNLATLDVTTFFIERQGKLVACIGIKPYRFKAVFPAVIFSIVHQPAGKPLSLMCRVNSQSVNDETTGFGVLPLYASICFLLDSAYIDDAGNYIISPYLVKMSKRNIMFNSMQGGIVFCPLINTLLF